MNKYNSKQNITIKLAAQHIQRGKNNANNTHKHTSNTIEH